MPRTQRILAADEPRGEIADTLLLAFDDRCRQQGFVFGGKGTCVEFDFPAPPCLHTDDVLVLDDGRLVEVVADSEPLIEVRTQDFTAAARLLLALGNGHAPVQVLPNRIRIQKRPHVAALIADHGLKATEVTAPFEPDHGAHGHDHGHHDHHHHGHDHGHGEHAHGHGHHPAEDAHRAHRHHHEPADRPSHDHAGHAHAQRK